MPASELSNYKNILVAVDLSVASNQVIEKAKALAASHQCSLKVIHIVEIPTYPVLEDIAVMGSPGLWDEELAQQLLKHSEDKLQSLCSHYLIEDFQVITGVASVDIVAYAENHNCDLIVIGSHGVSGIKRLLGSTTNAVINHAECDVLSIRVKG